MPSKQFVCGNADGPVPGQTVFKLEFFKNILIDYLIVDNIPENQLNPSPDFKHNYIEGEIERPNSTWSIGNKLIVVYSTCQKCNE